MAGFSFSPVRTLLQALGLVQGLGSALNRSLVLLSLAAAAVLYLLARDRAAQRALHRAERAEAQRRHSLLLLKSKEAQDEARSRAAHTQSDVLDRLRRGSF